MFAVTATTLGSGILGRYGFRVARVSTGGAALTAAPADMTLLDLGLPDMDGIDVCRLLPPTCAPHRAAASTPPYGCAERRPELPMPDVRSERRILG